jgi:hypothetical protein
MVRTLACEAGNVGSSPISHPKFLSDWSYPKSDGDVRLEATDKL